MHSNGWLATTPYSSHRRLRGGTYDSNSFSPSDPPPSAAHPITLVHMRNSSKFSIQIGPALSPAVRQSPSAPSSNHAWQQIVGPFPPADNELRIISHCASTNDLRIATDGSFFPETGATAHSWVFAKQCGKQLCTGPGALYGKDMYPLRVELLGILSALYILYEAETRFPFPSGKAAFHNDSTKAIKIALSPLRPSLGSLVKEHCDVVTEIFEVRQRQMTTLEVHWVKSHGTSDKNPAQDVHDEAHHTAHSFGKEKPKALPAGEPNTLPFHQISVHFEKDPIYTSLYDKIRRATTYNSLVTKIERDQKWSCDLSRKLLRVIPDLPAYSSQNCCFI